MAKLTPKQLRQLRDTPVDAGNRVGLAIELTEETQMVVADVTGFPQPYVSDVARGRYQTITVNNARKFAEYFGCQIEDLFPAREALTA